MTKINLGDNTLKLDIGAIEKYYGAKYVGEFTAEIVGEFTDFPASIFWRPENLRNPNSSEYFGIISIFKRPFGNQYGIIHADYIKSIIFNGLKLKNEIIYSRFQTDKATFDNGAFITGGFVKREWSAGKDKAASLVRLRVIDGVLTHLED